MYDSAAQAVLITIARCNKMDADLDILPSGSLVGHCSLFGLLILGLGLLYNELPDEPGPLLELVPMGVHWFGVGKNSVTRDALRR
jgi:hypothetical protein